MTNQIPDRLTYRDRQYNLNTFPMTHEVFERTGLRPNGSMNSGCWRGYVGSWEIKSDDMLYLTDMELKSFEQKPFAEIFKEATSDGLPATWVDGTLECTSGALLRADNFKVVFEYDTKFVIKAGRLISVEESHNEPEQK